MIGMIMITNFNLLLLPLALLGNFWVVFAAQPHILFMIADDLGYHDVGYHGAEISTPHINKVVVLCRLSIQHCFCFLCLVWLILFQYTETLSVYTKIFGRIMQSHN